jgi:diadenosine tetraphosphate (Ap4A) HIT family hydrolase
MSCNFCNIDTNPNNTVLREGEWCRILVSFPQKQLGHIVIVPKAHKQRLEQLTKDELIEMMSLAQDSQKIITDKLGNQGCDINIHFRPFLDEDGIKVQHLHIHLIPRNKNDALEDLRIYERKLYKHPSVEENNRLVSAFTN